MFNFFKNFYSLYFIISISCDLPKKITNQKVKNVLTTCHPAIEIGACSLPKANYAVKYPVALGDISSLAHLKFSPDLCGHILRINCGHGDLDVIVTNSNLGNFLN
jgi:hypothetical protein